jgi:hypothetical protein
MDLLKDEQKKTRVQCAKLLLKQFLNYNVRSFVNADTVVKHAFILISQNERKTHDLGYKFGEVPCIAIRTSV